MSSWMRSSGPSATEVMRAPRCPKADSGRRVADQAGTLHHGAISLGMQQWLVEQLRKRVQLKPGGDAGDTAGKACTVPGVLRCAVQEA